MYDESLTDQKWWMTNTLLDKTTSRAKETFVKQRDNMYCIRFLKIVHLKSTLSRTLLHLLKSQAYNRIIIVGTDKVPELTKVSQHELDKNCSHNNLCRWLAAKLRTLLKALRYIARQFTAKVFQSIIEELGVRLVGTKEYLPQANG